MFRIDKKVLRLQKWKVEAFFFLPTEIKSFETVALFTHGYTADKSTLLNWGVQLSNRNIPTVLFDLPGHYLGSFNEVDSFQEFNQHVHRLYESAMKEFEQLIPSEKIENVVIGGHSLGGLISLRASELKIFKKLQRWIIPVGYGIAKEGNHPLLSNFFQPFLKVRKELVSSAIAPEIVLPWIESNKSSVQCKDERIHLISGKDDVITTADAAQRAVSLLGQHNNVSSDFPDHLPHHLPELAIRNILQFLRKNSLLPKT